eukprot:m.187458 g.187458  ORF g.187458 m.187458 type:complete len:409 (-) comp15609_c0_seq5:60-1286(-)
MLEVNMASAFNHVIHRLIMALAIILHHGTCSIPSFRMTESMGGWGCPNKTMPCSVINFSSPKLDRDESKYGMEGGRVSVFNNTYHLFTAEMYDDPWNVAMRLAHWSSTDMVTWKRHSTMLTSTTPSGANISSICTNMSRDVYTRTHAALWEPIVVHNGSDYLLYYTGYSCGDGLGRVCYNCNGTIYVAISTSGTVYGPWREVNLDTSKFKLKRIGKVGIVLAQPQPGVLGFDSFHPYKGHDGKWRALIGFMLPRNETLSSIGIAEPIDQANIGGLWHIVKLDFGIHEYIENPVVVELPSRQGFIALADYASLAEIGGFLFLYSQDGITWSSVYHNVNIHGGCRTPLGLVPVIHQQEEHGNDPEITQSDEFYIVYTYRYNHANWYPYPHMSHPDRYEAVFVMKGLLSFD